MLPPFVQIALAPLPVTDAACSRLADVLRASLAPLLAPDQLAHLQRFRRPADRCARWLSRALLRELLLSCRRPEDALYRLSRQAAGGPLLPGCALSFAYTPRAVVCALAGEGPNLPALGVDAEWLFSPPPHASAFAARENPPHARTRHDSLRRWTIKEALLKARGSGLSLNPDQVNSGYAGQRRGRSRILSQEPPLVWRCLPLPEHWLSVAAPAPFRLGNPRMLSIARLCRSLSSI